MNVLHKVSGYDKQTETLTFEHLVPEEKSQGFALWLASPKPMTGSALTPSNPGRL